jgi:tRNA-specific 2-thiouridylase
LRKAEDVIELIARDLLGNVANVLDRKSSAGICFVGKKRNFSDFVHEYVQRDPAWFVDVECIKEENNSLLIENSSIGGSSSSSRSSSSSGISSGGSERGGLEGKGDSNTIDEKYILGECESVHSVTAGQRARIGGLPKPYFVVGKSTEEKGSSKVYVCEGGDHPALLTNWCVIKDIHFVHEDDADAINSSQQVRVKTRYASCLVPATIGIQPPPSNASSSSRQQQQQQQQKVSLFCRSAYEKATTTPSITTAKSSPSSSSSPPLLQITFASPEKAVSIGQAVVMYHHSTSRVLGVGSVAYHGRTVFEEEKEEEEQRRKQRQSEKKNDDDKE